MELDLYFRASDLARLATAPGVKSVVVSAETIIVPIPPDVELPVLVGYAKGYDENKNLVGDTVFACPTPCKPGGTFDCAQRSETILSNLQNKGYFSGV